MSPAQERLRYVLAHHTRPARLGQEVDFQRDLTSLDPNLSLRFNFVRNQWYVYYDKGGLLSVLRTIPAGERWPGETFRDVYQWLKFDGSQTKYDLLRAQTQREEQYEAELERREKELFREMGKTTYKCARDKVTTDTTDPTKQKVKTGWRRIAG